MKSDTRQTPPRTPSQRYQFLIVEDEALIAMDLQDRLEGQGYTDIVLCTSKQAALRYLDSATPRLAFLDINLGNAETSAEIALKLQDLGCPFTLLTGYSQGRDTFPARLETTPRLSKPVTDADLFAAATRMMAQQT